MKSGFETKSGNEAATGRPVFVPPSVEEITKLFPQLEIIELLGQGGMGAVYKARQPRLNRFVALKILSPEKQNDPQFAERFEREARALAWLTHPNIVTVYDFGEVQGHFYLLMEFVDGLTLRQLFQARKLSPAEALNIVPKICDALQYAHEQGVIHRDIKPENILLDKKGQVKIADFGIAKILDLGPGDLSLTGAKDVVGTPHYMAPEQIEKPQSVDRRADIYSLGVVFYEMLTGELPLGKFQPPSQKVQIDVRLDEVVLRALEKEPDRRYQQASEVKTDVETIANTTAPAANAEVLAREILAGDYPLDIGSCLHRGWALVRSNFWPVVGVTALILLLRAAAFFAMIGVVVSGPLLGGLCLYFLKKIRGERAGIGTAFSGFSRAFLPLFLASFVMTVFTVAGFFCLLLPGIYLAVAWAFTLVLVVDKRLGFWPAMRLSRKTISKHWWKFFGFIIVLSLIKMAGMLVLVVGFLITAPVALAALMYAYEDIFGATKKPADIPSPVQPVAATGTSSGRKIAAALLAIVTGMILLFPFVAHKMAHRNPPPPKVVSLTPANGATNVNPGPTEIQVVFDQPMHNSWSMVGGGSRFPELAGDCHYDAAGTTWTVPVKLKPGWTYKFGLNSKNHKNFKSKRGVPLEPVRVTFRTAGQPIATIAATGLVRSNASWNLLNENQRLVAQWSKFYSSFDEHTFDSRSNNERADRERRLIDTLKGPRSDEYYQAINSLAVLRSTKALPALREIAFDRRQKDNRDRWMSVRALGLLGDEQSVPEMIHLLYHYNVDTRWWAQISLVRLTGQNFGKDWQAWGNWWNSQNGQPPFNPEIIRWSSSQAEPNKLAESLDESDRKFLENIGGKRPQTGSPVIDDAFWLNLDRNNYQRYREELQKAPESLIVRPTHYNLNQLAHTGIGVHWGWIDGKMANLCVSFSELVSYAYTKQAVWDERLMTRTEFPQEYVGMTNQFDVIDTLRVQPVERLQAEIKQQLKQQFGLSSANVSAI
jgi:tRNA A-37 threonylcarbamoyl transferase component Bud32